LDEGFGTLDSETLDAALNALESLRLSGRTIGVEGTICRRLPRCFPSGMGSETFFRLRSAGYRGDLGKRSMGREP